MKLENILAETMQTASAGAMASAGNKIANKSQYANFKAALEKETDIAVKNSMLGYILEKFGILNIENGKIDTTTLSKITRIYLANKAKQAPAQPQANQAQTQPQAKPAQAPVQPVAQQPK
jgi:hypothetical protein